MATDEMSEATDYYKLVVAIDQLINKEMLPYLEKDDPESLAILFPKFIVMYEFFRMLRGEAFIDVRPHDPEYQKQFYAMEHQLLQKLQTLANKLNPSDSRVQMYLDEMKASFDLACYHR